MKVLVTGINGFVGTHLKPRLEAEGFSVTGIDIAGGGAGVIPADLADRERALAIVREIDPDCIVHLAGISAVKFNDLSLMYSANVDATRNIMEAASSLKRTPRCLVVSSSQVYGDVDPEQQPICEEAPLRPVSHYGATKASCEMMARAFMEEQGLPVAIIRPFNHIGRGQSPRFVVPKIVLHFMEGKSRIELGNVGMVRDYLDVRDVAEAYALMVRDFPDGAVYNLSSGTHYSVREIVEHCQKITGRSMEIIIREEFVRKNDILSTLGDSGRFRARYSWKPRYGLDETLRWILNSQ